MTVPPPGVDPPRDESGDSPGDAHRESMPQGWYDDPFTDELQRYWTGTSWTKQTRPRPMPSDSLGAVGSFTAPPAPPPAGRFGAPTIQAPAPVDGSPPVIRDYLIPSILSLIFCFWPLAIPAVYFAVRTNSAKRAGDIPTALRYSDRARLFLMISVVAGLLVAAYLAWVVLTEGSGALGLAVNR